MQGTHVSTWRELEDLATCPKCGTERTRTHDSYLPVPQGHILAERFRLACGECGEASLVVFRPGSVHDLKGGREFPYHGCCARCSHHPCDEEYRNRYDMSPTRCCPRCEHYSECSQKPGSSTP